jgi:hypothetical protein
LVTFRISPRTNHEGVKGVDGVCMIKLPNAFDGPRDIQSLIGYVIGLGQGMICNIMIPLVTVPRCNPHVETIVLGGGLGLIFTNITI